MAILQTELTIFNLSNWRSIIELDDKVYTMDLRWSVRAQSWFISLFTNNVEEIIINPLKLVLNIDMLKYATNQLKPSGVLVAQSDSSDVITFDNFGEDVKLYYYQQV